MMRVFVDMNHWAYRLDRRDPDKSAFIRDWLRSVAEGDEIVISTHALAEREQLSWFDALIAEAAVRSRCDVLYSEDFSHGRSIAGLRVRNPFLQSLGTET
ncbi:PIN domain-containing protein [Thioalkalivibrio sp. XN8]|uniref:PIN domain-containing protein n=1 Tax=Thioalkalivibrio sp. XN8 TaxID=2712863 RepID=UPI0013ED419A|nr:PIN domain-containing protein [Thioalkalivibrio sp. XN8]NGP54119.1 PIN domain-containing protein [Thioalkalivibrio sp. XN8]